jgi:uracil-DNA glycosylase family 4
MSDYLAALQDEIRACRLCLEAGHAIEPGPIFSGRAGAEVMILGQAPGITESAARRPFNAGSGRRLFTWLAAAGWEERDFRARHYMTAVTKCYPGKDQSGHGDRVASKAERALCRPFLEAELRLVRPRLLIPVGGLAIRLFYPAGMRLEAIIGTAAYIPEAAVEAGVLYDGAAAAATQAFDPSLPRAGRWVVPLSHPSGASLWLNRPENQALVDRAIGILSDVREAWGL